MEHTVTQLSCPQGEAKQAGDGPADAETEANRQRRKGPEPEEPKSAPCGAGQGSRLYQVRRWRLNELDDYPPQRQRAQQPRILSPLDHVARTQAYRPLQSSVPSSSEIHVFRAFVSNKRALNTLPTDLATCSATWSCRDDTTRFPLNPNMPLSLIPTNLQQTHDHSMWINVIPFPRIRDNLIRCEGRFDYGELMQDLTGELMTSTLAPRRRGTSNTTTGPQEDRLSSLSLPSGIDTDEVTSGRNGLIVWGEPHDPQSWEATPGFLAKWTWAVEGCEESVEISNTWRMIRGEEPMRLSVSRSYPPPPVSHVAQGG
ncbi:hypothetical protein BJX62DRAFT_247236 [Aspergillus germanicus]